MALASNDLAGMRKYAVCATTINRQETSASLNRKVAAAVIDVLLLSTHSSSIPQLVDQDFEMLRHLVRHGITFGRESLREVVLMCHFSLGKFLVEEAGVVPVCLTKKTSLGKLCMQYLCQDLELQQLEKCC
jgi:hypothetical protein